MNKADKIMVVDLALGDNTKITTIDVSNRNRIKEYKVNNYSNVELAEKILERIKKEGFNKLYIDANGIGSGLIDWVFTKAKDDGYSYDPKTGDIKKRSNGIVIEDNNGVTVITGSSISWDRLSLSSKEEF